MDRPTDTTRLLIERLKRAQAVAQIGSWELDLSTRTLWASEEAFRVYGVDQTPDQRLPLDSVQSIPLPEYRPLMDRALADLCAGRGPYDLEFEIDRPRDRVRRHIHSVAELAARADGKGSVVVGTLHDITDRKHAEEALRASEERFRMFLEHAADAIIVLDESSILEINHGMCALSGYARDELLGRDVRLLFSGDELARVPFRFDLLRRGETVVSERWLVRKDGTTVPAEMHSNRLPSGEFLTILRDVSERRRLEEQLQLRQRMDSVGTLASGIAHDFNNILVAILGYAELLQSEEAQLSPSGRESAGQIVTAAQRAADLVRRLQSLGRPDRRLPGAFDFYGVASDVFDMLKETTDRRIRKTMLVPPGVCWVAGQESDLYHALVNLGVNAVQAIEERGATGDDVVSLEASVVRIDAGHPLAIAPGDYVHVRLRDTGTGMAPEVKARAFDPLFSTKTKGVRKGQGLGLTMVYNIVVAQHGGTIHVESEAGLGTTFHLYLPAGNQGDAVQEKPAGPAPLRPATVLVVEDEPQVADLARRVLEQEGYGVLVAGDGQVAMELFATHADAIEVAIIDQTLPILSGMRVLEELMRLKPDLKIILSSGDVIPLPEHLVDRIRTLPKPYPLARLRATVREALAE